MRPIALSVNLSDGVVTYTAQAAIGNSRLLKFAVGANVDSNFDATVHLKPCGGTVCYAVFLRAAPSFIFDNVATFIRGFNEAFRAYVGFDL